MAIDAKTIADMLQAAAQSPVPNPNALLQSLWPQLSPQQQELVGSLLRARRVGFNTGQGSQNAPKGTTEPVAGPKPVTKTPDTTAQPAPGSGVVAPVQPAGYFALPVNTTGQVSLGPTGAPITQNVAGKTPLVSTTPTATNPSGTGTLPSDTQAIAQGNTAPALNDLLRRASNGNQPFLGSPAAKPVVGTKTVTPTGTYTVGGNQGKDWSTNYADRNYAVANGFAKFSDLSATDQTQYKADQTAHEDTLSNV